MAAPNLFARARSLVARAALRIAGSDAATSFFYPWQTGPRLGAKEMLLAYSRLPWLRAFTQKIADDMASLAWQAFKTTDASERPQRDLVLQRTASHASRAALMRRKAAQGRLTELPNYPLLDLLSRGNNWFPGMVSMQLTSLHLELVGEMAWLLESNTLGMPTGFTPIPPTWVTELPMQNGEGNYLISGPMGSWEVPEKDVLWAYHPDPSNPFRRGVGIAQVLGDELETDEYAAKHTKDWFRNRAIPPVLISGLGVGLPELQRLEEKWLAKYQRRGAGWLPQFLGKDVTVHQLSQTFEQQQLGPLRERERDTIRQVWGIPPEVVGIVENSNRATIDAADYIYNSRVIAPRAEFLRAVIQERLAPRYDDRVLIDYISPVAEDREFVLKVRQASPYASTVDEWRQFGGLDPLPGNTGRVHMIPFSVVPTDLSAGERPDAAALDQTGDGKPDALNNPAAAAGLDEEQVEMRARAAAVRKGPVKPKDVAAKLDWKVLQRAGEPVLKATIQKFGNDVLDQAGAEVDFNLHDPRVVRHIREFGAVRMRGVNATTQREVAETLARGVAEGETLRDLAARVRDVFAAASQGRAETIARTETVRGSNFGALEGMRQSGLEEKEWLATLDDHVREEHAALDGEVVGIDEPFEVDGEEAQYPGDFGVPELDINCRCAVITTMAERSAAHRQAQFKALEADRTPYVLRMRRAMRAAFRAQERAALAELERQAQEPAAAAARPEVTWEPRATV